MSEPIKPPESGSLLIDARPLEGILVDVKSGARRGMSRAQTGFDEAVEEIFANHPKIGIAIGVLQSQIDELRTLNHQMDLVAAFMPAINKLAEMADETQTVLDNRRHEIIRVIVKTVEAQAEAMKDESLLAKYEKARNYRSAIAKKAARTRKKNSGTEVATPQTETAE